MSIKTVYNRCNTNEYMHCRFKVCTYDSYALLNDVSFKDSDGMKVLMDIFDK